MTWSAPAVLLSLRPLHSASAGGSVRECRSLASQCQSGQGAPSSLGSCALSDRLLPLWSSPLTIERKFAEGSVGHGRTEHGLRPYLFTIGTWIGGDGRAVVRATWDRRLKPTRKDFES